MTNATETLTLTGFLLDRIAEDEAAARAASPSPWQYGDVDSVAGGSLYDKTRMIGAVHYEQPEDHDGSIVRHLLVPEADANGQHIARHDPARVLAECEAKRQIVEMLSTPLFTDEGVPFGEGGFGEAYAEALAHLAAVYADHSDYREAWRL